MSSQLQEDHQAPILRLAASTGPPEAFAKAFSFEIRPAILVSYAYLHEFSARRHRYRYRDWMLDSGAFSAWKSGYEIRLSEYIQVCRALRDADPTLSEIIGLDVIGSDRGSLANAIKMKEAGIDAMPVFHIGDDWGILKEYASGWDKVGLSCRFGESIQDSYKFYDQCFAKVWPKKFHSFGWVAEEVLLRYPFHSGDASSWEMAPCAFGSWKQFGKMSIRGSAQDLRGEVRYYLELEHKMRLKWRPLFERLGWYRPPDVRLAAVNNIRCTKALEVDYER